MEFCIHKITRTMRRVLFMYPVIFDQIRLIDETIVNELSFELLLLLLLLLMLLPLLDVGGVPIRRDIIEAVLKSRQLGVLMS